MCEYSQYSYMAFRDYHVKMTAMTAYPIHSCPLE